MMYLHTGHLILYIILYYYKNPLVQTAIEVACGVLTCLGSLFLFIWY